MFLIEKLTKLQDVEKRANTSSFIPGRRDVEVRREFTLGSSLVTQTCLLVKCASGNEDNIRALHFLCLNISVFFLFNK